MNYCLFYPSGSLWTRLEFLFGTEPACHAYGR